MVNSYFEISVDPEAQATYVRLAHGGSFSRTCEVVPGVLVDLDDMGIVIGIEVLDPEIQVPLESLQTKHHVRSEHIAMLKDHLSRKGLHATTSSWTVVSAARRGG